MTMLGGAGRKGPGGPGQAAKGGARPDAIPLVSESEFEGAVLRSELPVMIEFTASGSQACKQVAPEVEAFARETAGKVKVLRVDVDKSPVLARELRVQSVPMFILFAEQRIVDGAVGPVAKKKLLEMVEPFLPRAAGALKAPELAQLLKEGAVVPVDTREEAAFKRAHIPGAVNMPIDAIGGRLAELHMLAGQPVVYCRAGDKTKDLAATLAEQGVPVAFLEGGFLAWESEGLKVERP
jgi:thioredoxin-like negative regulator of GroEL